MKWNKKQAATWKDFKPPARLSKSEFKVVEGYVKKLKKDANVLILGSTVELRDLCYKYGIKPYVVDSKREVYEEWSKYLKNKPHDFFVNKDWLDMHFDIKFDLILGDCCFQQLDKRCQKRLYQKMNNLLKEGGKSIQRTWVFDEKNHRDLRKEYLEAKKRVKKFKIPFQTAMYMGIVNSFFYASNGSLYAQDCIKYLKKAVEDGIVPMKVYDTYEPLWRHYKNMNYYSTKEGFTKAIKKYLKIKNIAYGKDFYRKLCPIYILVKRK
jgi:hypothetical protein